MKFGPVATADAGGAILAHSLAVESGRIKKGTVLGPDHLASLRDAGFAEVTVARLEPGDIAEDEAARRIAKAIAGSGARVGDAFTGRANIYAEHDGIALIDADRLGRINRLDEAITVATLAPFARVDAGDMIATIKIIPFAAPGEAVAAAEAIGADGGSLMSVQPFAAARAGLVITRLEGMKESLIEKSRKAIVSRLEACGATLARHAVVGHDQRAVANAINEMVTDGLSPILVLGASAIIDRGDVIPAGLVEADGVVRHLGMPVDPGNLMMLGALGETPVLGVPSCARSPKLNGFDWVLERLLAGVNVEPEDIQAMGTGGLLTEIPSRPQPREREPREREPRERGQKAQPTAPKIAALVLAAGRSTRMGAANKLTSEVAGRALVRHTLEQVLGSRASPVIVVTGHEADQLKAALDGLDVRFVHNPDYAKGLSTSLAAGLGAMPEDVAGVLVCLGDMPGVSASDLDRLITAFNPEAGHEICVPVHQGKRGNPVLWGRAFFHAMAAVEGDVGARHLIGENAEKVVEVALDASVLEDIDTPAQAADLKRRLEG